MIVNEPVQDTFEDTPSKDRDPEWFKRAVFYEVLVRSFQDSDGDGVGDLKEFVDAAHHRGMRVIIDFVMNHTSDQHPWFQESRANPDGPYGDYYVWADDDKQYQDARIIFVDTEASNWTFDPVRKQYYWHRFFSHQPDLNYENPAVQEEMISALKFWLDLGIDGFRLDAVPYLYQEEGTNCENLPATHEFLKRVRKEIDASYPDTVVLAEANQWPEDVVDYFGDFESGGDECHMAFHFPVMPRIFMAVRRESRYPVSEILAKTPAIPSNCQWGIFLRNHDELCTTATRSAWATTSGSATGRLYLPTIMDPVYGYQVTNVEASMASPSSLLHWTRRMIEIRKQNHAFGHCFPAGVRGRSRSVREQLLPVRAADGAGSQRVRGPASGGAVRRGALPGHR